MTPLSALLHRLALAADANLGVQGGIHVLSYRDLYAAFGMVAILAMFNGLLVMACLALAAMRYDRPWLMLVGKATYLVSLMLQGLLGLAPVILIVRAYSRGEEASLAVYGMPFLQLAFIILVIFYQIRVVILYQRVRRSFAAGA